MPRHPLGEKPMTGAERQRKRRERLRQERPRDTDSNAALTEAKAEIARLRERIAELEAAARPAPQAKPATPSKPENNVTPERFLAVLSRALSDNDAEALTSLRMAQQMLKAGGHDWHVMVDAVGKAGLFKPVPKANEEHIRHVRDSAKATLKSAGRWMTDDEKQFMQGLIDDPLRYGYEGGMVGLREIMSRARNRRLVETRAKRAAPDAIKAASKR